MCFGMVSYIFSLFLFVCTHKKERPLFNLQGMDIIIILVVASGCVYLKYYGPYHFHNSISFDKSLMEMDRRFDYSPQLGLFVFKKRIEGHPSGGCISEILSTMSQAVCMKNGNYRQLKSEDIRPFIVEEGHWVVTGNGAYCTNGPTKSHVSGLAYQCENGIIARRRDWWEKFGLSKILSLSGLTVLLGACSYLMSFFYALACQYTPWLWLQTAFGNLHIQYVVFILRALYALFSKIWTSIYKTECFLWFLFSGYLVYMRFWAGPKTQAMSQEDHLMHIYSNGRKLRFDYECLFNYACQAIHVHLLRILVSGYSGAGRLIGLGFWSTRLIGYAIIAPSIAYLVNKDVYLEIHECLLILAIAGSINIVENFIFK